MSIITADCKLEVEDGRKTFYCISVQGALSNHKFGDLLAVVINKLESLLIKY